MNELWYKLLSNASIFGYRLIVTDGLLPTDTAVSWALSTTLVDHGLSMSSLLWICAADAVDTRCYFNVRSKADMSRLNLPHGDDN